MLTTELEIRRHLLSRFPWVASVEAEANASREIVVHLVVGEDAPADAAAQVEASLGSDAPMCTRYQVLVNQRAMKLVPTKLDADTLTGLGSRPTTIGLQRALVSFVPTLERLHSEDGAGAVRLLASDLDGRSDPPFLAKVQATASAVLGLGVGVTAAPLLATDARNDLKNPGFHMPRRTRGIADFTERENHKYAERLSALVDGSESTIPHVDQFEGSALVCNPGFDGVAPLSCFLPLYDRVYLAMPPAARDHDDAGQYFRENLGLSEAEFWTYCESSRVVPLLKFNLGDYPTSIADRFLNDLSLSTVTPRQLDYVVARYAWLNASIVRALRDDRDLSADAYQARDLLRARKRTEQEDVILRALEHVLFDASSFEGAMWHDGHLAAGRFSPGAMLSHMATVRFDAKDAAMASLDAVLSVERVALSQAFAASCYDGLSLHERVLEAVAACFAGPEAISPASGKVLRQIVHALDLAYSPNVPAREYMELFDSAETKRVRAIVGNLLKNAGADAAQEDLRDAIRVLNDEVRRLAKRDLLKANVDIVGDLATGGSLAAGTSLAGDAVAKAVTLKLVQAVGEKAFDAMVEDTALGAKLDALRGKVNGTSGAAVRLFRIKSRLSGLRK